MVGLTQLEQRLGARVRLNEPLSRYTTARIGGPADMLVEATSADDLIELVRAARREQVRFTILGGGANVLVSDAGVRGLTIINKSKRIEFMPDARVQIESGVVLPTLARECANRGLAGFEWATGVPGTIGGAIIGNAGAHGGDTASVMKQAWILEADDQVHMWPVEKFEYTYRSSRIKRAHVERNDTYVVVKAELQFVQSARELLEQKMSEFNAYRKRTQPPGATIGSMFKNPQGDAAGRLIEATGLKGMRIGQAEISKVHANFFVNLGGARAADVMALIDIAHEKVLKKFGVELELEVERVGVWKER